MPCNTSVTEAYRLSLSPSSINLAVTIGFGQNATSVVSINGIPVGNFVRSFKTVLNNVNAGDELTITTTVLDITPGNDKTSVQVDLNGGVAPASYLMSCDTPNQLTTAYDTTVFFNS